ncbi:MAG TPA: ABC transporter ATP-binding protein [Chloroflexota bacterium]|nr:ABC transporter ATP-binding protein [Chloroflexota bacterium]
MHEARRIYALLGAERRWVFATVVVALLASAAGVLTVTLTAAGIGTLAATRSLDAVAPIMVALVALIIARTLLAYLQGVVGQTTAAVVAESVRVQLFQHLARLGPGFLVVRSSGDVVATAVDGVESIQILLSRYLPQVVVSTVIPLAIFLYLLTISPPVALVLILFAPSSIVARRVLARSTRDRSKALWGERGRISALFVDSLQGLPVIKSFNRGPAQADQIEQRARAYRRAIMDVLKTSLLHAALTELAVGAGLVLALWIAGNQVLAGSLAAGQVVVLYVLARELYMPINKLNVVYHDADVALAAGTRIFTLLDAQPAVVDAQPTRHASRSPLPFSEGGPGGLRRTPRIRFESVTFAYARGAAPALVDLSFVAEPGQMVAIVGPSGAGKSTVVNLLLRFWDPQEGSVLIDEQDIRRLPLHELRALMAVVAQDTYLFNTSVLENIRLGRADATDDEVRAAARAASAEQFILALPDGFHTRIGERGARLSGGERQRLAIARAFLKNAPILLLDEATSSLDSANEQAVQGALAELMRGRTTIVIAHRLSTVANADRILVLDGGRLVEAGGHAELLGQQRVYSSLVAAQSGAEYEAVSAE